jgi:hypothetical protein
VAGTPVEAIVALAEPAWRRTGLPTLGPNSGRPLRLFSRVVIHLASTTVKLWNREAMIPAMLVFSSYGKKEERRDD